MNRHSRTGLGPAGRRWMRRAAGWMQGEAARYRLVDQIEQDAFRPAAELERLQASRLKAMLCYAGARVPYWRDLFQSLRFDPEQLTSPADLTRLPVLTKEIIRRQGERMVSRDFRRADLVERRTGGSTGEPLTFWIDRQSLEQQMAFNLRGRRLVGIGEGDKLAKIWGYGRSHTLANALAPVTGRLFLDAFQTGDRHLDDWVARLIRLQPAAIYGYPSAIQQLARHLGRRGVKLDSLHAVCTTAEKLEPVMRTAIEQHLGAQVIDMYGCHEVVRLASECLAGKMHMASDAAVLEFPGDDDDEEQPGPILVTSLFSRAMPFIRYDLGDSGRPLQARCSCGIGLPLMELDVGKRHHIFFLPRERKVHTALFSKALYPLDSLRLFQVRHAAPARIEILAVPLEPGDNRPHEQLQKVLKQLRCQLGPDLELTYRLVDELDRTERGKHLSVVPLQD